ncbi:tyrosine-type recombinase/integrase [Ornithinimicrobium kibberense]|uniref:tyrosine-type recombinase/integrase n=1 Tax=Ornithinimicrobium kibberense TaxID=282060 RepID=UPI00361DC8CE
MQQRELKPRTRDHYRSLLERHILPELGTVPLTRVTSELVREWYMQLDKSRPTLRAHAYGLLRTILGTAVTDGKISSNPCHIRGAGSTERTKQIRPATLTELETITLAMPEKYRPMVLLSSWCALRFGELIELRTKDIDLRDGVIHVRRGVVRTGGQVIVGTPKSAAGSRDVAIPPHLIPVVHDHIERHARGGRDALLFPAADGRSHLAPSTLYRVFYRAREAAGRPDLRWHDLRHTGAVLAAQTGATLAELMARLGHSTPQAALRYQHAAQGRDAQIAQALSRIAIAQSE